MDLTWLEALVVTVEHGSFQTAAFKQGISRATLRNRVEALENHIGVPLLVRTVRGVELTDVGKPFVLRARALLADAASLTQIANEHADIVTGELCIRVPTGMPPEMHVLALSRIRQRYPRVNIRFNVHEDPTADIGPETDFVLHFCPRVTRGDFQTVRLWSVPLRLIASAGYLAERGTPQTLEDLSTHALMTWISPSEDGTRWPLRSGGSLAVQSVVCSSDIATIRGLVVIGTGIALVPDPGDMLPMVTPQDVVPVLPDLIGGEISIWMLLPAAHVGANRTRAVVEITKDILQWIKNRSPQGG